MYQPTNAAVSFVEAYVFHLRTLLLAIGLAAVATSSLVFPSLVWQHIVANCAIFSIAFAIAAAIILRDEYRAFWLGFCFLGWTYYLTLCNWLPLARDILLPGNQLLEFIGVFLFDLESADSEVRQGAYFKFGIFQSTARFLGIVIWGLLGGIPLYLLYKRNKICIEATSDK